MGGGGSKQSCDETFEGELCSAIRSWHEQREFCDLVILSASNVEYHEHKIVVSIAFPELREYLKVNDRLNTVLSGEVIKLLQVYAYQGVLTLDSHVLGLVSALLSLMSEEELKKRIQGEVRDHIKTLLETEDIHEALSKSEMAVLVFVAKLHNLDILEILFDWNEYNSQNGVDSYVTYVEFMDYLHKTKEGAPLSLHAPLLKNLDIEKDDVKGKFDEVVEFLNGMERKISTPSNVRKENK